ncbi:MAG TPA: hypothetical protein DCZ92_02060 [Elusimicrobia bacterium]|nr:MAG: hypothetical protein A2016_03450 [Elusimicrobia bacterium GWF2_62_30]HBA59610.1 hypothetical protein [Elusimicrobiota bacterium]
MNIPINKNVAILSTPPTFVGERLCPLGLVPIAILKLVAYLKGRGNRVEYINMHSGDVQDRSAPVRPGESSEWKEKPMGCTGNRKAKMLIHGRSFEYFAQRLKGLEDKPHEIWISCAFTFDYDLVRDYVAIARKIHPAAKIVVGGDFVRETPELAKRAGADDWCTERIPEADACAPDFSSEKKWEYGLFQLQLGCVNKCSFCHISMDRPRRFEPDEVLGYMQKFYDRYRPTSFWNWDPNVTLCGRQLGEFLDKFADSPMKGATISFGKGLQPNLVTEELLKKMVRARVYSATLPMESANYETLKRLNKPYTLISSIKTLELAKNAGLQMSECRCTSLLGYPDDDFSSFFRVYLAVLKYKAVPSPFPVYLFPGSPDYKKYYSQLKHKDLADLHGQLWPLLPEKDIDKYLGLFKFIELTDFRSVKDNLGLLSADLKGKLLQEFERSDRFIDLCLNAKNDTLDEFRRIEKEIAVKKTSRKKPAGKAKNILCVIANPAPERRSVSRHMAKHFIETYAKANPAAKVTVLDLCEEGLPFINREYVEVVYYGEKKDKLSAETEKLISLVEKYIGQLKEADEIVIATPMYTLSIPAVLKAYLELIASRLYYFYSRKMLSPKPVLCLLTRDGFYPPGLAVRDPRFPYMNVQETILTAALSFLGLAREPKFIVAGGLDRKEYIPRAIALARKEIEAYVAASARK